MTTQQAVLELQNLNRKQRQLAYKLQKQAAAQPKPRKRYKLNKGMCFFWLNALGLIAFVASNVAIKISMM